VTDSVIVIGGGLVGSSTAYFAAREGIKVTLLEQVQPGYGASGRNPGFVWLHCRNPGWALDVSFAGRKLYDDLARDLPVPFEFRAEGGLIYFTDEAQVPVFTEFVEARRADGLDMHLIDGAEVRKLVEPIRSDVVGASYCTDDAQINTPTVVAALAAGAIAEGADIREGVTVTQLLYDGDRVVGVDSTAGKFYADTVVVASGPWTEKLMDASGLKVNVGRERLQVIASKPVAPQIRPIVYGPSTAKQYALFRDLPSWDEDAFTTDIERELGAWMLALAAQRANGEILFGCPMDYPADVDHSPTIQGLKAIAQYVAEDFPGLGDIAVDRMWAGTLPFTSDMVPIVDQAGPGLFIAAGHVFGNSSGPMTGKLVSQLLRGVKPEIDLTEVRWDRHLDPIVPGQTVHW
jgi:glycine/D-amino acid oxidase-like deaminating enzyme